MQYYCCRVDLSSQRTSCCCKGANVIAAESCGVTKLRWVCRHSVRCADHLKISSLANTSVSGVERRERKITTDPSVNLQLARGVVTRQVATFFRFNVLSMERARVSPPRHPPKTGDRLSPLPCPFTLAFTSSFRYERIVIFYWIRYKVLGSELRLHFPRFIRHSFRFDKFLVSYRDLIKFAFSFFLYICIYIQISLKKSLKR